METKKELNLDELDKVNGGDMGDNNWADTPEQVQYRYDVGRHVEVYNSVFHVATTACTIVARYPKKSEYSDSYTAAYDVTQDYVAGDFSCFPVYKYGITEVDIERDY